MAHQDAFPARDRSGGIAPSLVPPPVSRSPRYRTHRAARAKRRARLFSALLPLLLVSGLLSNWAVLIPTALAAAPPTSTPGHNTYQQFLQQSRQQHAQPTLFQRPAVPAALLKAAAHPRASATPLKHLPSVEPATMQDQVLTLDDSFVLHRPAMRTATTPARVRGTAIPAGTTPLLARGSDGRLEVDLPRGSLDFTHASLADGSAPVGQLLLQIHQVSGHFIEAESILGTYQLQIVDSQGNVVQGVQLLQPLTLVYHYQNWEMQDLNINPDEVHLAWSDLLAAARTAQAARRGFANAQTQSEAGLVLPMTNDASAQTLTAQSTVLGGTLTASATPELAAPTRPDLFETSGNSGQYAYSYPLAVAPGPAGFAPQLALSYSSQSTNGRHSRRAPAGAEGEGFALSLGSISMAQYPASSTGNGGTWYFLNGVDGISDRLAPIPNQSGFYETEHISHLRIQFTGSCWRIWGLDGTYTELGCTADAVQKTAAGPYEWDVNKILAPYNATNQVKTMFVTYLQDSPDGGTTIRDAGIKQIQYGFATSTSANSLSLVSGTVDFHYHMPGVPSGQSAFASAYGTNFNCASAPPSATTLRCDDPGAFNGVPAPAVMSTLSLDTVSSYIGSDSTGNLAYRYSLTYQDTPYVTDYFDSLTLVQEAAAGAHLLTQITPTVFLSGVAHARQPITFGYTGASQDMYRDPSQKVANSNQQYGGQTFWHYLNQYEDLSSGVGAHIQYSRAYGNMHGTPYLTDGQGHVTDDRFDPLYCTLNASNPDPSKQCTGTYGNQEDYSWSMQVVTQVSALGTDSSGNATVATTSYHYALAAVPASRLPLGCNPISGTGVPAQEASCVADTWSPGYDGTPTPDHDADWQDYYHIEFRGFALVYTTSPANNLTVDAYASSEGWWTAESNGGNYTGGQLYQQDSYQGNVATPGALLRETRNYYVGGPLADNPYDGINTCNGLETPIYTPCLVALIETKTISYEGQGGSSSAPWVDTVFSYDDVNLATGLVAGYHNTTQQVISSSNAPTLTKKWTYQPHNGTDSTGVFYYDVNKVVHSELNDNSGHVWQCQDTTYDQGVASGVTTPAAGWPTTVTSYSTCGNASTALTSSTGYDQYGNVVATVDPLGSANPGLYSGHGCTLATAPTYVSSAWTAGSYTSCATYDPTHSASLPVSQQNAFGQTSSRVYDYTSGAQPSSATDANGQVTNYSYAYDASGNETINVSQPGETGAYTTRQVEGTTCASQGDALPCYQVASNASLYAGVMTRTFYDAQGRAVETRTPGPTPGDDTVVMTVYNDQANTVWTSVPFQVASGSAWLDPTGATDILGMAPAGTTTFLDALGRTIAVQDPNFGSAQEPGIACSTVLSGPSTACTNESWGQATGESQQYALTTGVDPNGHVSQRFTDALGRVRYTQTLSGLFGGTLSVTRQTQTQYNALGKPTSVAVVDEAPQSGETPTTVVTTMTYDDLGRLLTLSDPDQGTFTSTYDPDGHVLSLVQTSGSSSRTIGYDYDLLGRIGCEATAVQTTISWSGLCSGGSGLVRNTYDSTRLGTQGSTDFPVGQLTQTVAFTYYPDGSRSTVTEQYQHDQRGRLVTQNLQLAVPTGWNVTNALPIAQLTQLYNDANQPTTTSTSVGSAGYTFTQVYDGTTGTLTGLSNNGAATANLATLAYNEHAQISGITFQTSTGSSGLANEQFSYDGNLRPTTTSAVWLAASGQSGTLFQQTSSYDQASNVTGLTTTHAQVQGQSLSGGTQTENFCYDEQNRLLWAGNSGTQPGAGNGTCGSGTLGNTLPGGATSYNSGYIYTHLGQLWQGPAQGSNQVYQYLYCDTSHAHQVTGLYPTGTTCASRGSATAVYSTSYDAWGNQSSRVYNGVTATLSYDQFNRLVQWNGGSAGQEQYVYDISGQRVLKRSTSGTTTSLRLYAFGLGELLYQGDGTNVGGASNCFYYSVGGLVLGKTDGTNTTFFLSDGLGSVVSSFSNTANSAAVLGNQTYEPYGKAQYQQGSLGTSRGYTGQYTDNLSGLDYYNARYYDPVAGLFLSADSVQGNAQGMDPYAYVAGNPETLTDPTGHAFCEVCEVGDGGNTSTGEGTSVPQASHDAWDGEANDTLDPSASPTVTVTDGATTYSYNPTTGNITASTSTSGATIAPGESYGGLTYWQILDLINTDLGAGDPVLSSRNSPHPRGQTGAAASSGMGAPATQTGGGARGGGTGGRPVAAPPPGGPGRMDPQNIHFTQSSCSSVGAGYTVEGNIEALQNGSLTPDELPAIRVFQKTAEMSWGALTKNGFTGDSANLENGRWYTLDNRRLHAFQRAGINDIPVEDVSGDLNLIQTQGWKFTTSNGGESIVCE